MIRFENFASYNQYVGLKEPLDDDIDIGYYQPLRMRATSDPVLIDFYRISIKINLVYSNTPDATPITAVFFNSPNLANGWDIAPLPTYTGMYLQLSKKIIAENRFLFKNYLDYGQHEALYLTETEVEEIRTVFELMTPYYNSKKKNNTVLLSYVNVLVSLVEAFYKRQFSTDPKQYNRILTDFQQHLHEYYRQPVKQLPTVQYFADKLGLSANYLGDIIKHLTNKSALENIHDFVVIKAKELLEIKKELNSTEVAYELGFEYPNYFAKFFKKQVNLTPRQYRQSLINK
ncbi:helix-turn-helix domain-containing protein [Sphingobacterium kitahiroshimense]|uniref:Helix-turn-helix domain-containing protein n=1 Tax=Sphingobacterium kitahiroshimense TaxID=470446 RepID=A0ABV0BWS3_9SPHI